MATSTSTYEAFKKYILFHKEFQFVVSFYFILNKENCVDITSDEPTFLMTYQKFKKILIKLRQYAKDSCGVVCSSDEKCQGHKILEQMQQYDDFIFDSVDRRKCFYRNVKFIKKNYDTKMFGYIIVPNYEIDLGWHTWSQRMRYLLV